MIINEQYFYLHEEEESYMKLFYELYYAYHMATKLEDVSKHIMFSEERNKLKARLYISNLDTGKISKQAVDEYYKNVEDARKYVIEYINSQPHITPDQRDKFLLYLQFNEKDKLIVKRYVVRRVLLTSKSPANAFSSNIRKEDAVKIGLFIGIVTYIIGRAVINGYFKYTDMRTYLKSIKYYWKGYLRVLSNPNFYADDINKLIRVGYNFKDALVIIALAYAIPGKKKDIIVTAKQDYNKFLLNPKIIKLKGK